MNSFSARWCLSALLLLACCTGKAPVRDNGVCVDVADGTECDSGLCCSGTCSVFLNDPNNCGACGLICPNGEPCENGLCLTCADLPDGGPCSENGVGVGECCAGACSNILADANNCGACGSACPIGDACVDAGCVPQCQTEGDAGGGCTIVVVGDGTCCAGVCVNPSTDNNNCYSCGNVCPSGQNCQNAICE